MRHSSSIFAVISLLVIALIYGSFPRSDLFSAIVSSTPAICEKVGSSVECCVISIDDKGIPHKDCIMCPPRGQCTPIYSGLQTPDVEERPPAGPAVLPEDGVLEQPPTQGVAPPLTRGQGILPQDGVLQQEQPPADQGETAKLPTTDQQPPGEDQGTQQCSEGQVFDEETGLCVLEEPETVEEEPELPEPEEPDQQEQTDDSEDNNNN